MNPTVYPESILAQGGVTYSIARVDSQAYLRVQGDASGFQGAAFSHDGAQYYPLSAANAAELRRRLPWLQPQPLGLQTSMGFGDRLGLATPGHIQAVRGTAIAPVFAQQSVRENARTGRTPQQVLDDALWGVMQCGWREPWGADADHLKTTADLAPFVAAGYSFFTVDPGEHVDHAAHTAPLARLRETAAVLPWEPLNDSLADLQRRYLGQTIVLDGLAIEFSEESLLRAACKYGRAVAHAVGIYRELRSHEVSRQKPGAAFDFEMSVDETETPTGIAEHFYIAAELARLNVRVTSLAPRFVGRFEKGVDYIGDLDALAQNFDAHARIARHFNYKLSLHSGSDKFSVYPLFATSTAQLTHVKTAGTSYLEALRTLAVVNPPLFREILKLGIERYPTDRATYHVSADTERVPEPASLTDAQLPALLDQFDARRVLHVTFGSALARFGDDLKSALRTHQPAYNAALEKHFAKHLAPFRRSNA